MYRHGWRIRERQECRKHTGSLLFRLGFRCEKDPQVVHDDLGYGVSSVFITNTARTTMANDFDQLAR